MVALITWYFNMKIIELYPKEVIKVEDDECLNCFCHIDKSEVFCSEDCELEYDANDI
nr:hypothetical protein [uncultured Mediterranean phage uvMED]